jgi:hypothetical protein
MGMDLGRGRLHKNGVASFKYRRLPTPLNVPPALCRCLRKWDGRDLVFVLVDYVTWASGRDHAGYNSVLVQNPADRMHAADVFCGTGLIPADGLGLGMPLGTASKAFGSGQVLIKPFSNRLELLHLVVREFARIYQSAHRLKDPLTFVGGVVDHRGDKSNVGIGHNWRD